MIGTTKPQYEGATLIMSKQSLIRSVRHYKTGALQRLHVGGVLVIYSTVPICPTTFFLVTMTLKQHRELRKQV